MVDKDHCVVCGKKLSVGLIGGTYGGKCRICGARCCTEHWDGKTQLCPYCKEKAGKNR